MNATVINARFILAIWLPLQTAALLSGCGSTERSPKDTGKVENIDQIVNAVPGEEMKERWRKAETEGQLPDLSTLQVPKDPIEDRSLVKVEPATTAEAQREPLSTAAVAGLRLFSEEKVERYKGSFKITKAEDKLLVGTLDGREQPMEIHFQVPGNVKMIEINPDEGFDIQLRDELENNSLRKMVVLQNDANGPVLLYFSEGGAKPYERVLEEPPLSIRQIEEEGQAVPLVEVKYGDQMLSLKPGDRKRAKDAEGELEVFLMTSYRCPPRRRLSAEGDLYHVTLIVYRVAP